MRIGKSKTWVAAGRRLLGQSQAENEGAVATEERNALLGREGAPVSAPVSHEDEPVMAGDPTQHLLTALGRFHRQVVKAKSAASQEEWCDECMNQIVAGIEIAISQEWTDVQEALTDAARILLSYEEARRAQECVPFLQEGYEILCLMVGDLIVDNVRSGVMDKWRKRYEAAVEDLLKAGLALIEDDSDEDAVEESSFPEMKQTYCEAAASEEAESTFSYEPLEDSDPSWGTESGGQLAEDADSGETEPEAEPDAAFDWPVGDGPAVEAIAQEPTPDPEVESALFELPQESSPFQEPEEVEHSSEEAESNLDLFAHMETASAVSQDAKPESEEPAHNSVFDSETWLPDAQDHHRDSQLPEISLLHHEPDLSLAPEPALESAAPEDAFIPEPVAESVVNTELDAGDNSALFAGISEQEQNLAQEETSNVAQSVPEPAIEPPSEMTFSFVETVLEETPAPVAAVSSDEEFNALIASLSAEAAAAQATLGVGEEEEAASAAPAQEEQPQSQVSAPAVAPAPVPPLTGRAAEAEARLQTTHEAMLRGDVADAKLLAIKLASDMAQIEVERGETQVRNRQTRLEVDGHGIASAEEDVRAAEKALQDTEWHMQGLQTELLPKREHVVTLREQVSAIDNGISDLEAQIRELEARRAAELQRKGLAETELAAVIAEQERIEIAVENLKEVERGMRDSLAGQNAELARRNMERTTHQKDLETALADLEKRRNSLEEIQRMIELLGGPQ